MNKKIYFSILFSLYLSTFSFHLNCVENVNSKVLLDICSNYIDFINHIGGGQDTCGDGAPILFTEELKKNFNGRLVAENRDTFISDLLSVYKNYGSWKLVPLEIIAVPENNTIILRINIEAKNFGKNTAIVLLHFDSNHLIKEIIEVFSPIQESYEFKDSK